MQIFQKTLWLMLLAVPVFAQQAKTELTPAEIMARVAAHQDRAETERTHYIYVQHARVFSRKGKTVMCEEITDSRIVPTADGSTAELLKLNGRQWVKREYVTYTDSLKRDQSQGEEEFKDGHIDRHLVQSMRTNLTQDKSKDGLAARLFPLTSKDQEGYKYKLVGRERMNGRDVFHIHFEPKDKHEQTWKGDAYIDAVEYQPVVISTKMAHQIPFMVKTLMGTNLPGLGFTVVYAPQADGVWFPVSFGSEFGLRIFFLFNRTIVIDAQNRDFEKTHITSRILGPGVAPPQP